VVITLIIILIKLNNIIILYNNFKGKRSSQHGPDQLGCTRATLIKTKSNKKKNFCDFFKNYHSSDCVLQLVHMKLKSLVIINHDAMVN